MFIVAMYDVVNMPDDVAAQLPAPRYALRQAQVKFDAMQYVGDFDSLVQLWEEFLVAHQRVWNKAERQYRTSPFWGPIRQKYGSERDTSPLLVYLQQARHADEHGIAPISRPSMTGLSIQGSPGGRLYGLKIDVTGVHLDATPQITVTLAMTVVAQPVVNRGVRYDPPVIAPHRDGPPVGTLAKLGLSFYERMFAEIKAAEATERGNARPT